MTSYASLHFILSVCCMQVRVSLEADLSVVLERLSQKLRCTGTLMRGIYIFFFHFSCPLKTTCFWSNCWLVHVWIILWSVSWTF